MARLIILAIATLISTNAFCGWYGYQLGKGLAQPRLASIQAAAYQDGLEAGRTEVRAAIRTVQQYGTITYPYQGKPEK
jgi:hypothetical protein